jgi:Ion channel
MSEPESANRDRRQRYGAVLGALVTVFAIQGIAVPSKWEQILVSALLGVVLLLALWETRAQPRFMLLAVLIVAGVILTSIGAAARGDVDGAATRLSDALVVALAPPAIVIGLVRDLRARREVTLQTVFGVLSVYLLIGMFFANVFVSIDRLGGNPFFAGGQQANVPHCLYYSFTTLTTVGYGDLTARTSLGHTLSVSEGLLGQIYLVTVVALIVTNLGRRRRVLR